MNMVGRDSNPMSLWRVRLYGSFKCNDAQKQRRLVRLPRSRLHESLRLNPRDEGVDTRVEFGSHEIGCILLARDCRADVS